jgi:hypothetical protein
VARQAVQLGYLPRLRILHTSSQTIGQIYVGLRVVRPELEPLVIPISLHSEKHHDDHYGGRRSEDYKSWVRVCRPGVAGCS